MEAISPAPLLLFAIYQFPGKMGDVFNIIWALVFGFATLNILGLVARRYDTGRNRFSFGELIAIMVVGALGRPAGVGDANPVQNLSD